MLPVPVGTRVPVHAADRRGGRAGHLVVADDVGTVERDGVLRREVAHEPRRLPVEGLGVPRGPGGREALVLEPDGVSVDIPVARVPRDVLRGDVLGDVAVGGSQRVVPRHVGRVLDQLEGRAPARLGVVDDDGVDGRPGRGALGEVVVAVVTGAGAVLLVGRRHPVARESLGALDAGVGLGPVEPELAELVLPGGGRGRHEGDGLPVGRRAGGARRHHGIRVIGERRRVRLVTGVTGVRHRGVPLPRIRRGTSGKAEQRLGRGEQGGAAADVGVGVPAEHVALDPEEGGRPSQRVDAGGDGASGAAVRAVPALGLRAGEEGAVDEVHRAVAAVGVVLAGVGLPPALRVGDRLEHRLRDAVVLRRTGERRRPGGRAGVRRGSGGLGRPEREGAEERQDRGERHDAAAHSPRRGGVGHGMRLRGVAAAAGGLTSQPPPPWLRIRWLIDAIS